MDYHKITLYALKDKVDIVSSVLYDFGVVGVEVVDHSITEDELQEMFADVYDLPETNSIDDEVPIYFYLPIEQNVTLEVAKILGELNTLNRIERLGSLRIELDKTLEEDWAHNWKKFYKPFIIDEHILIKPIWNSLEEANEIIGSDAEHADIVIDIDPGLAFGSGTHETTSMCITALDKYMKKSDFIIDIGCGSGILGMAAAKLGASGGTLVDLDERAVKVARENTVYNKVHDKLIVLHGNLLDKVMMSADVIVANIFADVIINVVDDATKLLRDSGYFICSGIIKEREADVVNKLESIGLEVIEVLYKGDWVAIVSRK